MRGRTVVLAGVVLGSAVSLTACSDPGDLEFWNGGDDEVTVQTGDDETTISGSGGVVFLDYGCTPGDVTVVFSSGESVVIPGPVCPDRRVVIGDGTAFTRPADTSEG
ncbi:hypothetical protein [Cellulomonas soli]